MIGNAFLSVAIALLLGYVLGSIPSAYLITRLATGKDIRRLGGGNVGGLNTFKEVGVLPAIGVILVDVGKGTAAVAIAHSILHLDQPYVLVTGLAAIVGHNWMAWLRFSGGKGMGTAVGAVLFLLPVYGYAWGLLIFAVMVVVPLAITRNVALSNGIGLLALPFIAWLNMHSGAFVLWSVGLGLIITLKFAPTALAALRQNPDVKSYIKGS